MAEFEMEEIKDILGESQLVDDIDPEEDDADGLYKDFSNMREFHVLDEIVETNANDDDECKEDSDSDFSSSNEADSEEDFDIQQDEIDAMLEEGNNVDKYFMLIVDIYGMFITLWFLRFTRRNEIEEEIQKSRWYCQIIW